MANKSKTVKIDDGVFQSKMRKMAKRAKIDEYEFIKEQGALYARDIAKATPPMVGGKINLKKASIGSVADRKQGEWAMWNDLRQIFVIQEPQVIQWAFATFGRGKIYKGRTQTGAGIALSINEIRRFHLLNMRNNGRTRSLKYEDRLWVSEKILAKYFKEEKKNVGSAKASIAKAMVGINPKQKVPGWISRNMGKASSSGHMVRASKGPRAVIRASAAGLQHVFSKLNFLQRFRLVAMEKRMKAMVRANAKKSGFRVR